MKKTMTRILLLVAALILALGVSAYAEEPATETCEAWLLYFASGHKTDPAEWTWWPQHTSINHSASETGVEYTNARITGPGKYTVGLKFNWQKAEGATQFNLILDNGEKLFPGYYVDITDIRVNGQSIEVKENMYGTYHDDPESGMVSIYNTYWDTAYEPGATGPSGHRAFDGTVEDASYLIINPDDIVNGSTLEVDFIVAAEAGAAPEELGEKPSGNVAYVPYSGPSNTASLFYLADGYWPSIDGSWGVSTTPTITGEGNYTVRAQFVDQGGWTPSGNGVMKLHLTVTDIEGANSAVNGKKLGISDVRVNGASIDVGNVTFGKTWYDSYFGNFDADDGYAILFDDNVLEVPGSHSTWDGSEGTTAAVNPADMVNVGSIEVDFFITDEEGNKPAPGPNYKWSGKNTVSTIGLTMRDLDIADDWHSIVPIDLTKTAWYCIPLSISNAFRVGNAFVSVNNGNVNVFVQYFHSSVVQYSENFKWFTSLDQVSPEAITDETTGYTSNDVLSVQDDLGGAEIAYLAINSKAAYRSPLDDQGNYLPRYYYGAQEWKDYRASLMEMLPAAE